jgi:probable HAF family extracellular repeat protein
MLRTDFLVVLVSVFLLGSTSNNFLMATGFQGVGHLPVDHNGFKGSFALDLSADGTIVVGDSSTLSDATEAFKWTASDGVIGLGDLPGNSHRSTANAISANGSVIVGESESASGREAFIWTGINGMVGLGDLPGSGFYSTAQDISADGTVIVGFSRSGNGLEAFRWTEAGGMVGLGDLPGGSFQSRATAVSADGSVVVGNSSYALGAADEAFLWTEESGMIGLGGLPGQIPGDFKQLSSAIDISADGKVVVGQANNGIRSVAFRWTKEEGMSELGLPPGINASIALAASTDGSIIVGQGWGDAEIPLIWTSDGIVRPIQEILVNDLGLNLNGWTLIRAFGVSDDGLTIVGMGMNPNGDYEGWVATIPEPGSYALLLGIGGVYYGRRRS